METRQGQLIIDTHTSVTRMLEILEGDDGICERVKANSHAIGELEKWTTKKDARSSTLAWIFGGIGTVAGVVIAILQFALKIKVF